VVGVARSGNERDLTEAGAGAVVKSVSRVRFLRRIPSALDRLEELSAWRRDRSLAVFLDYDGTLSPIVDDPRDATMSDAMRSAVSELAGRCPVAIISGRDRRDVESRVGIDGLLYAGNHGFDISGRGHDRTVLEAEDVMGDLKRAGNELERRLGRLSGVLIERKRFSVAVHFRQVGSQSVIHQVARAVESVRQQTSLRKRTGKKVLELEPAVDWDKGRALRWLIDVLPAVTPERSFLVYIGDDETDEDAFAVLEGAGAGVRVGAEVTTSLADYRLADPREVRALLGKLAESCAGHGAASPTQ
jgi:alpha,alpha-trehalase